MEPPTKVTIDLISECRTSARHSEQKEPHGILADRFYGNNSFSGIRAEERLILRQF
jgi:hypothetical protein